MTTPPKWPPREIPRNGEGVPLCDGVNPAYVSALESALARAREALEIIAGTRQCVDNLMSNVEISRAALAIIPEIK